VTPAEITELMRAHGLAVQRADFVVFRTPAFLPFSFSLSLLLSVVRRPSSPLAELHPPLLYRAPPPSLRADTPVNMRK